MDSEPKELNSRDIDDAWDDILMYDQKAYDKGFEDGRKESLKKAQIEGTLLGLKKGQEVGSEIGFYKGVCQAIRGALPVGNNQDELNAVEIKAWATLDRLQLLLDHFPVVNDKEANLAEKLMDIRTKYKQLLSVTGLKIQPPSFLAPATSSQLRSQV